MNNKQLEKKLREISKEAKPSIRREVAKEALSHSYDDLADFFTDLLSYGCVSGIVASLIYYVDTHKFFNTHYEEIELMRIEYKEQGITLQPNGDLKNWYAWFAFEESARKLAQELGIISH